MSVLSRIRTIVLGRELSAKEASSEQITPVEGLSALSLDALTSVAYGPEAILLVLAGAGASALHLMLPITIAIIVSNHGGRQLDGVPGGMEALVDVLDAVGGKVEVLVDGGFRRGADVVKAVALGAKAAMIGRPWAYGLAAAGEPGIKKVLSVMRQDIDRTLRLLGVPSVSALDLSYVTPPEGWVKPKARPRRRAATSTGTSSKATR